MDLVYLAAGIVLGGVIVWLLSRGKRALIEANARAASEADRASLSQELKGTGLELVDLRGRLQRSEDSAKGLSTDLNNLRELHARQGAELGAKTERLDTLQAEHDGLSAKYETLRQEHTKLQASAAQTGANLEQEKAQREALETEYGNLSTAHATLQEAHSNQKADLANVTAKLDEVQNRATKLDTALATMTTDRDDLLEEQSKLKTDIATRDTTLTEERKQNGEKLKLLQEAREELTNHFRRLAGEILDEKSQKFTDLNKTNLDQLLNPFKEKIEAFQKKVEDCYDKEGKDRSALAEQVKALTQLNTTLSQDAQNLTLALKGDRKAVGNWGEVILEDLLERAGLVEGQHYKAQGGVRTDDGQTHVIPDVVVLLPGNRNIVIDSKMSLPDYRAFAAADGDEERAAALQRHLVATRAHMKGLFEKQYQTLYGLASLDFVVMFMPLEPAFMLAVTNDRELFHDGWDHNVLLVSPSTLLFVVRTIAALWRQEDLSRNARDISRRGAELYDKLTAFVGDLQKVGERLNQAQQSYDDARRKLSEGRGNVIRQAEMLKGLGVKPSKALPAALVDSALDDPIIALPDKPVPTETPVN